VAGLIGRGLKGTFEVSVIMLAVSDSLLRLNGTAMPST
jgi:hypothetical protein